MVFVELELVLVLVLVLAWLWKLRSSLEQPIPPPATLPQSQATVLPSPGQPQPQLQSQAAVLRSRDSRNSIIYSGSSPRYPNFELKAPRKQTQTRFLDRPIEMRIERYGGYYEVFLSDSVLQESKFPAGIPEKWYYATSILIGSQHFLGTKNEARSQIISAARIVVAAERDEVSFRAERAVKDKSELLERYHELDLYLHIGKYVEVSKWTKDRWTNIDEGIFGCTTLPGGWHTTWVRKGERQTEFTFSKSDLSERLWRVVALDDNKELDKEGNHRNVLIIQISCRDWSVYSNTPMFPLTIKCWIRISLLPGWWWEHLNRVPPLYSVSQSSFTDARSKLELTPRLDLPKMGSENTRGIMLKLVQYKNRARRDGKVVCDHVVL